MSLMSYLAKPQFRHSIVSWLTWRFGCTDRQTSNDDEEGRVALTSATVEDTLHGNNNIVLLDTEIPNSSIRTKKKKACCMCCGYECVVISWPECACFSDFFLQTILVAASFGKQLPLCLDFIPCTMASERFDGL